MRLDFLEQKKPEVLSEFRNKNINDVINKNNSQLITNYLYSKKNIVEIKSDWKKREIAFQKRYYSPSIQSIQNF